MNKKGVAGVVFLVISLLVVSSGLIITVNKLQKTYEDNNIAETGFLLPNSVGNSFSLDTLDENEGDDDFVGSFSGGGGSSGKSSSSSSSNAENIENDIVTVIDRASEEILTYGTLSSYNAFSLSGPRYSNCTGTWIGYKNAEDWFNNMSYNTEAVEWPNESQVQNHIQSNDTVLFYEVAHGGPLSFKSGCSGGDFEITTALEIETWINDSRKMPFTFLDSCGSMCETGEGSLSYAFRKGSNNNTVTIGYCDCDGCDKFGWQNYLFDYMNQGWTVKDAFDKANEYKPDCANCTRFAGDEDFKIVWYEELEYCKEDDVYRNTTKHNLVGSTVVEEEPILDCGEDSYGTENYCYDNDVYRDFTDKGCLAGSCFTNYTKDLVQDCEYGCESGNCTYPDLIVEDLFIQNIVEQKVVLAFTIKNIGDAIADQVYWMIDTNSSDTNPTRIDALNLDAGDWTRAYMMWTYSSPGNYTPKVIVDFNNSIINEINESNNEASISISV